MKVSLAPRGGPNTQEDIIKTGCYLPEEVSRRFEKSIPACPLGYRPEVKSDDRQRRPLEPRADPDLSFFVGGGGATVDDIPVIARVYQ